MNDLFGLDENLDPEGTDASLDLTPIIDVVFLLLIFFIMATTFSQPVLDVVLPPAESAEAAEGDEAAIVIVIDREGRIEHEGRESGKEELARILAAGKGLPVMLHVDEKAPFEPFVMVMDQAKLAGREHVSITVRPAP